MKISSVTHASTFLLITAISGTAFGSGFALNEQSARLTGQAFAGRASDADNASTLVTNPAGMSLLKSAQVSLGASFIDASSDIKNVSSTVGPFPVAGSNDGDMIPFTTIPFGYYVQPLDDKLAVGFGVYAPFGLATEHEDEFQGRYFATVSDIQVVTFQPTISYKLNDNLSLGLGITYNRFDGKLEKATFTGGPDLRATVKGDDDAWGYNIGAIYEFSPSTRVGITYYSKVKYTLEGHTTLTNIPSPISLLAGGSSARYDAKLDIETPDRIDVGVTHALTPQLTLHGQIARSNWKTLDEIRVKNEGTPAVPGLGSPFAESLEPLDWDPSMLYALGLSYKLNPQWTLRGGIAFDEQPIPSETRSVRLPAGDRTILSIGSTWTPVQNLDVDFSYMYIEEDDVTVDQRATTLPPASLPIRYSAKFENKINIFALQGTWKF